MFQFFNFTALQPLLAQVISCSFLTDNDFKDWGFSVDKKPRWKHRGFLFFMENTLIRSRFYCLYRFGKTYYQ